jgi:hypothetical protein
MADGNHSNPYRPDAAKCCEACVFGRGEHETWCDQAKVASIFHHDDFLKSPKRHKFHSIDVNGYCNQGCC